MLKTIINTLALTINTDGLDEDLVGEIEFLFPFDSEEHAKMGLITLLGEEGYNTRVTITPTDDTNTEKEEKMTTNNDNPQTETTNEEKKMDNNEIVLLGLTADEYNTRTFLKKDLAARLAFAESLVANLQSKLESASTTQTTTPTESKLPRGYTKEEMDRKQGVVFQPTRGGGDRAANFFQALIAREGFNGYVNEWTGNKAKSQLIADFLQHEVSAFTTDCTNIRVDGRVILINLRQDVFVMDKARYGKYLDAIVGSFRNSPAFQVRGRVRDERNVTWLKFELRS